MAARPRSTSFGMEPEPTADAEAFGDDEPNEPSLADAWADTLRSPTASPASSTRRDNNDTPPEPPSTRLADAWLSNVPPPPKNETGVKLTLGDASRVGARTLYTFYLGRGDQAWTVKLRYSECAAVFSACAKTDEPLPAPPQKTWRLTARGEAEAEERGRSLARYLGRVVASSKCWALLPVRELFGVSSSTFNEALGPSAKEGWCLVEGRRRWVVAKPRYLAVYEKSDAGAEDAIRLILEQATLTVKVDGSDVGVGPLALRCEGRDRDRRAQEWADALKGTIGRRRTSAFAPQRTRSRAQFYIGGKAYFAAVKGAVDAATTTVCVAGWRIEPQTPLQRDPVETVLDVLGNAVQRGVRVCVLLHRELSATMQPRHKSAECAEALERAGCLVLRHPRPMARQAFWTHHEKVVVVDQQHAFVGGLDLCEGRYDDLERRLRDDPPATYLGREYYQPAADPTNVIDRASIPRLPWHDVAVRVDGGAALDVFLHVAQRWEHHRRALSVKVPALLPFTDAPRKGLGPGAENLDAKLPMATACRVVRSAGGWSLGLDTVDASAARAWADAIAVARHFVYVEQQYWITSIEEENDESEGELDYRGAELLNVAAPPEMAPGDSVQVPHGESTITAVVDAFGRLRAKNDLQPANTGLLENVKESMGTVWDGLESRKGSFEKGVKNTIGEALLERLRRAILKDEAFRALILLPLRPKGRLLEGSDDAAGAVLRQQRACIAEFLGKLRSEFPLVDLDRFVFFATLRTHDTLAAGPCSEMVYVHSKVLIVDDIVSVVGSCNVNDRSLRGGRDTEVAVVVEGPQVKDLRLKLWRAHLGIRPDSSRPHLTRSTLDVSDVLACWPAVVETARRNATLIEAAFDLRPLDDVATLEDARSAVGLGRVSRRLANLEGAARAKVLHEIANTLAGVRGDLCAFPEKFLGADALAPPLLGRLVVGRKLFQ